METIVNPTPQPEGKTSVLDVLKAKSRQTQGKVNEVVELRGNVNSGKDEYKTTILSLDAVRTENNNQPCRLAFKGDKLIEAIEEKAVVIGEGEQAQILLRVKFKLKRSDDVTYFVSNVLDFADTES